MTRAFSETSLYDYFSRKIDDLKSEVNGEERNRLLNVNEDEYVDYLVSKYDVDQLEIDWNKAILTDKEVPVSASRFPMDFNVEPGKFYHKQLITYHFAVSGDTELLRCRPSRTTLSSVEICYTKTELNFSILNLRDDHNEIDRTSNDFIDTLRTHYESARNDIDAYNHHLRDKALEIVKMRKGQLLKQLGVLEKLGVPVQTAISVPKTFAIESVKRRPLIVKPKASNGTYLPEPTLDQKVYVDILRITYEVGKEMERHPDFYKDKGEEVLRDHFLIFLSPNFQSVTGETFNFGGKTDLLIRHEGRNVFVGECKVWRGKKQHSDTISQILGYLTWRDSKAAIMYFVKHREIQPVLEKILSFTPEHPCYVSFRGNPTEGRYDYSFHLPNDSSRSVRLAMLVFHFPS